jgi:uncharacterized protein YbaR (Trm112 family)
MKPRLLTFLACPACGGKLGLEVTREAPDSGEILAGDLRCPSCAIDYRSSAASHGSCLPRSPATSGTRRGRSAMSGVWACPGTTDIQDMGCSPGRMFDRWSK